MKYFNKFTNLSFLVLIAVFALSFSTASAVQKKQLVEKHSDAGVQCIDCHAAWKDASAPAKVDACLGCHDGYEWMAEKTKNLQPNPHASHLGNVKCTECHKVHAVPSQILCDKCHNFGQVLP